MMALTHQPPQAVRFPQKIERNEPASIVCCAVQPRSCGDVQRFLGSCKLLMWRKPFGSYFVQISKENFFKVHVGESRDWKLISFGAASIAAVLEEAGQTWERHDEGVGSCGLEEAR
ncbi:MAG: hypothetical protein MI924_37990 [Chloroflexales bacterium]|nr:hypothetical protein [Chloroflexales bacterium]